MFSYVLSECSSCVYMCLLYFFGVLHIRNAVHLCNMKVVEKRDHGSIGTINSAHCIVVVENNAEGAIANIFIQDRQMAHNAKTQRTINK
jgi:hypothetical protein